MAATEAEEGNYVVISADCHCGADVRDYKPYLESRYHEEFDAWASTYSDGWAAVDVEAGARRVGVASFTSSYNWDGPARLAALEGEGIVAEVLFPNTALLPERRHHRTRAPLGPRARATVRRDQGAQPLAGRVLRRRRRPALRHRPGVPP